MERNLLKNLVISLLLISSTTNLFSQDSSKYNSISVLPVPAFGYAPETRTYIGAVSLFTINFYPNTATRTSNAKVELNYTWNKQFIVENDWNYFFKDEKWFSKGLTHFSLYPDLYFGIGSQTKKEDALSFESRRVVLQGDLLRKIKDKFYVGGGIRYLNYKLKNDYPEFQELVSRQTFGIKFQFLIDSRNNILTATKGKYLSLAGTFNRSKNFYTNLELDARKYYTLDKKKSVLAFRVMQNSVFGNTSFYDWASIGGDKIVRGYRFGRYRDANMTNFQGEFRFVLYRKWSLATFGGSALIYNEIRDFSRINLKPNLGFGVRFRVDEKEKTNLRFDYAIGSNANNGLYISFGESF